MRPNPQVFASKIFCPCGVPRLKSAAVGFAVHRDDGPWFGTAAALLLLLSAMLHILGKVIWDVFQIWWCPVGRFKGGQCMGWRFWAFDRNNLTWTIQSQIIVEADTFNEQMNSNCNVREVPEQFCNTQTGTARQHLNSSGWDGELVVINQKEWLPGNQKD